MQRIVTLFFFLLLGTTLMGQGLKTISGKVLGKQDKLPLFGVNVLLLRTGTGTTTDMNGNFVLEVLETDSIEISYIGYQSKVIEVNGRTFFEVSLVEGENLGKVVVTALSIQKEKEKIGYSVQEISSESISRTEELNVINVLEGKIAGLQVDIGPTPGASSRINLRGIRFLNQSNQPLIILDGVPLNSTTESFEDEEFFGLGGQDFGNGLNEINPNDIENISVLKGINAASLYGSRGANGVILINTKKGAQQKGLGMSFKTFFIVDQPFRFREVQNEYGQGATGAWLGLIDNGDGTFNRQFVDFWQSGNSWGPRMNGEPVVWDDGQVKPYEPQPDNIRSPLQNGGQQGGSFSLSAAGKVLRFRAQMNYTQNPRIFPNSSLSQFSAHTKTNAFVSDRINIEFTSILSANRNFNPPVFGNSERSFGKNWLYNWNRSMRPDVLNNFRQGPDGTQFVNIGVRGWEYYKEIFEDEVMDQTNRLINNFAFNYQITSDLFFRANVGRDYRIRERYARIQKNEPGSIITGGYNTGKGVQIQINAEARLDYDKALNSDVNLKASVGVSHWNQNDESLFFSTQNKGLTKENIFHVSAVNIELIDEFSELGLTENIYRKTIRSTFGYIEIAFRKFLNFQIVGRNDWSSTLPLDNNSYFYPSFNATWNIGATFPLPRNINKAILRGSIAQVRTDEEPFILNVTYDETTRLGQYSALLASRDVIPPVDLQPSLLSEWEGGLLLEFFESRLTADITVYQSIASGQSILAPVPESSGFKFKRFNTAQIQNTGLEMVVSGNPILREDFSWNASSSITFNQNKVLQISEDVDRVTLSRFAPGTEYAWAEIQAIVGQPYGVILNNDFVYSPDGQPIVNPNGTWKQTETIVPVGNVQPNFLLGLTNNLNYKGFSLNVLLSGKFGHQAYWGTKDWAERLGQDPVTLEGRDAENGGMEWVDENGNQRDDGVVLEGVQEVYDVDGELVGYAPNDKIISVQQAWASRPHAANVLKGSFFRFREVSLGYMFPSNLLNKLPFTQISLQLVGRNLFYLYSALPGKYNPEAVVSKQDDKQGIEFGALPSVRSFGVVLNFSF